MSDEIKRRLEDIINSIKKELDEVEKRIDSYLSRGESYRAYRVWRDAVIDLLHVLQKALDSMGKELKKYSLGDEEIRMFTEHLRTGMEEIINRIEEMGNKIKGEFRGRRYSVIVQDLRPFRRAFHDIIGNVNLTIEGILDFVDKIVENIEKTLEDIGKKVTQVVSVRIREDDLKIIDELVDVGIFRSRSEAVAFFTRRGIEASKEWIEKALEQAKKIKELQEAIRKELGHLEDEEDRD